MQIGGSLAASAIGLVTFVAVTRGLGAVDFGVLTTALVYLMIPVILADVGLTTYVVREISAQPERTAAVMQAAMPLRALVSAVAVGVAVGGRLRPALLERDAHADRDRLASAASAR